MTGWEIFADAWTEFDRREPGPAAGIAAPAAPAAAGADAPGPGLFLASSGGDRRQMVDPLCLCRLPTGRHRRRHKEIDCLFPYTTDVPLT